MNGFWLGTYLVLAAAAVAQAALFLLQTWEHRRFARSRLGRLSECRPIGRAMLLAPCKGLDLDLEKNLDRLFAQDYDDYEITFIVEDAGDPALRTIQRLRARHSERVSQVVVAGKASQCGQKVHNLAVATRQIDPRIEYLVFVDSDAQPRPEWLRALLGRLGDDALDGRGQPVGAATGYRWMIPARPGLANHLLSSINAGVATLFGSRGRYPIWGGSWAIRRALFEAIGLREAWPGTLSDDLVASRVLGQHGLAVKFEPGGMVVSRCDIDLSGLFSFLRRQYLIGRVYSFRGWALGLAGATLANGAFWGSLGLAVWGLFGGGLGVGLPGGVCAALFALGLVRAALRQSVAQLQFSEDSAELVCARRFDLWAGPLASLVNWLGMLASAFGRHIAWRGITYRLRSDGQIEMVDRPGEEPRRSEEPGADAGSASSDALSSRQKVA